MLANRLLVDNNRNMTQNIQHNFLERSWLKNVLTKEFLSEETKKIRWKKKGLQLKLGASVGSVLGVVDGLIVVSGSGITITGLIVGEVEGAVDAQPLQERQHCSKTSGN